jgi:hypothetical protein
MAHPQPCGGWTAQEELSCAARNDGAPHRQGKKVVTTLLRQSGRGEDVLRADQPITRGRLDAGWNRGGEEIKATLKAHQERQDRHHWRFETPQVASGLRVLPP